MIPQIIHYCWFGNNPLPEKYVKYIEHWKQVMPDYTIKYWSEKDIDIQSIPFLRDAYKAGKLAFVADYVRLQILYREGGVYMDTDVEVYKSFDSYLNYSFFTSYEFHPQYREYRIQRQMTDETGKRIVEDKMLKIPGSGLMSAIMGAEKGSAYIKEMIQLYDSISYEELRRRNYTIPTTLALVAERYGFRYTNEEQHLRDNIVIFKSNIFADYRTCDKSSVAVHRCADSWGSKSTFTSIKQYLYKKKWIRAIYMRIRNLFEKYPVVYF